MRGIIGLKMGLIIFIASISLVFVLGLKSLGSDLLKGVMDLKELDKFFKMCRKHGVTEVNFEGIDVKFGDLPKEQKLSVDAAGIETEELTPDQLMYYAVQGAEN